ncbi:unnamed protein product [Haemonchus placei]|uniref:DUF4189 domain-containing protein n=1 Tax=Haemonchus placei TaxID=6290 RepID=A0A0N4W3R0_HAEPC|nr:unnamed protein product [Haemonchus placei]
MVHVDYQFLFSRNDLLEPVETTTSGQQTLTDIQACLQTCTISAQPGEQQRCTSIYIRANNFQTSVAAACQSLWAAKGHLEELHALEIVITASPSCCGDYCTQLVFLHKDGPPLDRPVLRGHPFPHCQKLFHCQQNKDRRHAEFSTHFDDPCDRLDEV